MNEAEGRFEIFPNGIASQDDAADALIAHDKSPIKLKKLGRYSSNGSVFNRS